MGKKPLVVMHYNGAYAHQRQHAACFAAGLGRHGIKAVVTTEIREPADIHIVSGPHYALSAWRDHPRVLLLDRAYWGDSYGYVSLRWMFKGVPHYPRARSVDRWQRCGAHLMPLKEADHRIMLLGDFASPPTAGFIEAHGITAYRPHPHAQPWGQCWIPLVTGALWGSFSDFTVAHGFATSTLVTAGLAGLNIIAHDPQTIAARWRRDSRVEWCHDLAYLNWHGSEIADGSAWEWLRGMTGPQG